MISLLLFVPALACSHRVKVLQQLGKEGALYGNGETYQADTQPVLHTMVELFLSSKANISEHIKHVFDEGELVKKHGCSEIPNNHVLYKLAFIEDLLNMLADICLARQEQLYHCV